MWRRSFQEMLPQQPLMPPSWGRRHEDENESRSSRFRRRERVGCLTGPDGAGWLGSSCLPLPGPLPKIGLK